MSSISADLLKDIPYIDHSVVAGRFLSSLMFFDLNWQKWVLLDDHRLIKILAWPAEGGYFSRESQDPNDLYLHFIDFMARYANYSGLEKPMSGIHDDIFNVSASLAKLALLERSNDQIKLGLSRMATTEVEYIIVLCRSLFDLLQEVLQKLWDKVSLIDKTVHKKPLKPNFSGCIFHNNQLLGATAISEKFGLPLQIAACYERASENFAALRRFRDNIVHNGSQVQHIFAGDGKLLIAKTLNPFGDLHVWDDHERETNDLVPLLPAIEVLIFRTILVFEDFSTTISQIVQWPPPIVPDMRFYMRGYFTDVLIAALESGERRSEAGKLRSKLSSETSRPD